MGFLEVFLTAVGGAAILLAIAILFIAFCTK